MKFPLSKPYKNFCIFETMAINGVGCTTLVLQDTLRENNIHPGLCEYWFVPPIPSTETEHLMTFMIAGWLGTAGILQEPTNRHDRGEAEEGARARHPRRCRRPEAGCGKAQTTRRLSEQLPAGLVHTEARGAQGGSRRDLKCASPASSSSAFASASAFASVSAFASAFASASAFAVAVAHCAISVAPALDATTASP